MYSFEWAKAYAPLECAAEFKQKAEDFLVTETLSFTPVGQGEHVYLLIEKINLSTTYVADQLARWSAVQGRDVSYAGLKDRASISRQWFSLWLPGKELPEEAFDIPGVTVIDIVRHDRKLRRGAISENKFSIRLRNCTGERNQVEARIQLIAEQGVPNYFGPQRFGHRGNNITDALTVLGRRRINRDRKGMLLSAVRSYLFNTVLSTEVSNNTWKKVIAGQPLQLSGSKSWFLADGNSEEDNRVLTGDCSPTCALYGDAKGRDTLTLTSNENAAYEQFPELVALLAPERLEADRRSTVLRISNVSFNWLDNDLVLVFGLPTGTYATSVLNELMSCITE